MLNFPEMVEVEAGGQTIIFYITEIRHNVFALQHHLHAMKNGDDRTFGYIIYKDDYLYACCASAKEERNNRLIFVCYVGPESKAELSSDKTRALFQAIAISVVQMSLFENKHPSFIDKDTFQSIFQAINQGLKDNTFDAETPFITPLYEMALELKQYYSNMVSDLERLRSETLDGNP